MEGARRQDLRTYRRRHAHGESMGVSAAAIAIAIEHVESRGQWWVVSGSGCVGVMQVCPQWSKYPKAWLLNPAINREEGNRILNYWYTRAHHNWHAAIAAYRCGNGGLTGKCGSYYANRVLKLASPASTDT